LFGEITDDLKKKICCHLKQLRRVEGDVNIFGVFRVKNHDFTQKNQIFLGTGRWFSPGPLVSSTNETDHHDITEILLKVALNTIKTHRNQSRQ
jgi:hypothetical protein